MSGARVRAVAIVVEEKMNHFYTTRARHTHTRQSAERDMARVKTYRRALALKEEGRG